MIELARIGKVYRNGDLEVEALSNITFSIEQGELVSIMGPSGSGKSTLMNILGCLDRPTSGVYQLAGRNVSREPDDSLARIRNRELGFVFQSFNLLPRLSALANVELPLIYRGLSASRRRKLALEALELVGLKERVSHRPAELSGGERQRVAIARAIVGKPKVLLADEPTGNLDTKASLAIMSIFQELNVELGITVVQVTHDPEMAHFTKRVINLRDGQLGEDRIVSDYKRLEQRPAFKEGGAR